MLLAIQIYFAIAAQALAGLAADNPSLTCGEHCLLTEQSSLLQLAHGGLNYTDVVH